ncbi:MAG: hypothetical protein HFJ17_03965 [Clostridia bacterium]|nr:hypothetical protein [Clostridia bacterium]
MTKVIKEIIIMLLVSLITMLAFAIILYEYIPNRKVVAEVSKYSTAPETETLLADNIDSNENEVVLTYEVSSKDLSTYQVKNEYVPGKANPFESYNKEEKPSNDTAKDNNVAEENKTNETEENSTGNSETEKPVENNTENKSFIDDGGSK